MLRAVSGWVFARDSDGAQPMDLHLFDHWLRAAEEVAGLPKRRGGLWHAYRQEWATERNHLSFKEVAAGSST